MKKILNFSILFYFLTTSLAFAYNNTPNYWKCDNRRGGQWIFGRAPYICDVDKFLEIDFVEKNFLETMFFDQASRSAELRRYMTQMHAIIAASIEYFFEQRKPQATADELAAFKHAFLTVAHQESFWSHYRQAVSGQTQMMRGDYGHGHGMMQIDDRWHYDAITTGRGANLVYNVLYSLDEYFAGWERAPSKSCVSRSNDWVARSRAAYSSYNGGSSRICRFTNPNDTWARNDKGFYDKYKSKAWENYIDDLNQRPAVNVACIAQGKEDCRNGGDGSATPEEKQFYKISSGETCVLKDESYYCVNNEQDRFCLADEVYGSQSNFAETVTTLSEDVIEKSVYDRHQICQGKMGLHPVGSTITIKKNINMRATPSGALVSTTKSGDRFHVLDFYISDMLKRARYYKIKYGNQFGYIYAGNVNDYDQWAVASSHDANEKFIASSGDRIELLRDMPLYDHQINPIAVVNKEMQLEVINRYVRGDENSLYYKVQTDGMDGYLFVGNILPSASLYDHVSMVTPSTPAEPEPIIQYGSLVSKAWYRSLRSCADSRCKRITFIRGPRLGGSKFKIISQQSGWLLVDYKGKRGYLSKGDVNFL